MFRALMLCVLAAVVALVAKAQNPCETGQTCAALIISNGEYSGELSALPAAAQDARIMGDALDALGFEISTVVDLDRQAMREAISEFENAVSEADIYLVYYSGHGFSDEDGENFLLPVDVKWPASRSSVMVQSLSMSDDLFRPLAKAEKSGAKGLFLLDSCRDTPFQDQPSRAAGTKGFVRVDPSSRNERYIFYSSSHGGCGRDDSLFAKILAHELNDGGDIVRAFGRVRAQVMLETNLGQQPELQIDNLSGEPLCLTGCAGAAAKESYEDALAEAFEGTCTGAWARPDTGEPRYALVIGNNGYSSANWSVLEKPVRDADTVAGALVGAGFSAVTCHNLPREKLRSEIDRFARFMKEEVEHWRRESSEPARQPSGFLYFSGHGAARKVTGETYNYLIPIDSQASEPQHLPEDGYNITTLADELEGLGSKAIFIVVDACRNVLDKDKSEDRNKAARVRRRSGMLMAYATAADEVAKEKSGYAEVLAEELVKPGKRAITVFADVGIAIRKGSGNAQIPVFEPDLLDQFYFVSSED
ncbi:MAG: caspase family protein [Pseudomonadota bacterium]